MEGVVMDGEEERRCLWCDRILERKEGETEDNWKKRLTCDKRCASFRGNAKRGKGRKVNRRFFVV
jgi:hypothetical protein